MFQFPDISLIGVAVATIASFILGGVWFSVLFGRAYSKALGRAYDPSAKPPPLMLAGPAVWALITAVATAVLMALLGIETMAGALGIGALVGLGFLAPTTINTGINPNIPHPLLYGVVSGAYHLLSGMVIAFIIVLL